MTSEITRRRFLGTTATLGAAAAVAPASASPKVHPPGWRGTERVDKIPTTCEMCFWRCGVVASVAGGKVVRVAGHPEHPQNQGRLCARGNAGTGLLYDPDRLKTPLLRIGERGEGRFKRVSWDEALEFLAGKLLKLRQEHGPESVALFPHGNGPRFFATLMQAYGTPNSAEPSFAQCRGPREVGYSLTFGRGLGSPEPVDLEEARLIVLIGSHLGENVFTSQITAFATGLAHGAKLIAVDPRFSTAAAKADWWLPIRPGTDIALLLAWMNVLIGERLYDREYIETYAKGFDQLEQHVKEFTPEWAAPITDLPAAKIRETARAMGAAKPAVAVHPGRHVTWYGDDTQRARAMAILTALLGSWGRRGGIFLPTPVPRGSFDLPEFPEPKRGRADGAGTRFPLAPEELGVTNGLIDATLSGDPYPIKAWIVYGQNVLESIPQRARTLAAIGKLDLMVVVDVLPVEQIKYADLVLPEATYLERYDPPTLSNLRSGRSSPSGHPPASRCTSRSPVGGSPGSWQSGSTCWPTFRGRRPSSTSRRSSPRRGSTPTSSATAAWWRSPASRTSRTARPKIARSTRRAARSSSSPRTSPISARIRCPGTRRPRSRPPASCG